MYSHGTPEHEAGSESSSKLLCPTGSSSLCSVLALCNMPSCRLWPSFLLGAMGCKLGGHSRVSWGTEPSSTHTRTTPMAFPTSMRWQRQSWPRPAAQHLWKREEHFSLTVPMTVSLGISVVSGSWFFFLGHWWRWGWRWKEPSYEWENFSFHLPLSFQFYWLSWYGCQTF